MFKHRFPVLLHGIHSKSVKRAGQLIVVLAAINNFIVIHSTPQEVKLTVITLLLSIPISSLQANHFFIPYSNKRRKKGRGSKRKGNTDMSNIRQQVNQRTMVKLGQGVEGE